MISLPDAAPPRSAQQWKEFVATLDRDFDSLVARIPEVRVAISEDVLQQVKESAFESDEPIQNTGDLEKRMKLTQLVLFPSGEARHIYQIDSGDPLFGKVDYCVDLNAEGDIEDAHFDG